MLLSVSSICCQGSQSRNLSSYSLVKATGNSRFWNHSACQLKPCTQRWPLTTRIYSLHTCSLSSPDSGHTELTPRHRRFLVKEIASEGGVLLPSARRQWDTRGSQPSEVSSSSSEEFPYSRLYSVLAGTLLCVSCFLASPQAAFAWGKKKDPPAAPPVGTTTTTSLREASSDAKKMEGEQVGRESLPTLSPFRPDSDPGSAGNAEPSAWEIKSFLEKNPKDMTALRTLLHLRMKRGEIGPSIEILDKMVAAEPNVVEWKYVRAQALEHQGNFEAAREGYEQILDIDPFSARALQGLASVMQKTGEDSLVLEMLETAVESAVAEEKHKEASNIKILLGQMHMTQGNMKDALMLYKEVAKADPTDFRPHLCKGLLFSIMGKTELADKSFKRFHKLCPDNFPNKGYLDEMMVRAKSEAKRLEEKKKQDDVRKKRGRPPVKPMQQPRPGELQLENDLDEEI